MLSGSLKIIHGARRYYKKDQNVDITHHKISAIITAA